MNYNALSRFSSAGVAETYFDDLGIDVVVANELLEERGRFYNHLYPETNMIIGDITISEVFDRVVAEAKANDVDLLIATNRIDEPQYKKYVQER